MARGDLGEDGALDDLRQALQLGLDTGAGYDTAVVHNNMVEPLWVAEGPATAVEAVRAGTEFAEHRGLRQATMWLRTTSLGPLFDLGRWDQVLDLADQVVAEDRGDLADAARRYHDAEHGWKAYGHVLEHGQALLGGARCLLRLDRPDAPAKLRTAQAIFASLDAHPLATETDTWLVDATA